MGFTLKYSRFAYVICDKKCGKIMICNVRQKCVKIARLYSYLVVPRCSLLRLLRNCAARSIGSLYLHYAGIYDQNLKYITIYDHFYKIGHIYDFI